MENSAQVEISQTNNFSSLLTLAFNYLNLAIALILAIFAVIGYGFSLIVETTIHWWIAALILAIIFSLALVLFGHQRGYLDDYKRGTPPSLLNRLLSILPFLIFIPAIVLVYSYPHLQASYHSDLHSPFVDQIQFGTGQPRDIYFFPAPANYYWLYHALIATLSQLLSLNDVQVWGIVNIIVLISSFGWVYKSLAYVLPRRLHPLLEAMLVIFIVFSINLFGFLHSMIGLLNDNPDLSQVLRLLSPMSFTEPLRLGSLFLKYPNYNSFPIDIMYTWLGIYLALKILNGKFEKFDIISATSIIIGGTAYLLIGGLFALASFFAAAIPTALLAILWSKDSLTKIQSFIVKKLLRDSWGIILFVLLLCIPILPYAYMTISSFSNASDDDTPFFVLRNFDAILTFIGSYYPLMPFGLLGAFLIYRKRDLTLGFLWSFYLVHLGVSYFFNFTHGNEYKFVLLGVFPLALITVRVLDSLVVLVNVDGENSSGKQNQLHLTSPISLALYVCAAINIIGVTAALEPQGSQHDYFINATDFGFDNSWYTDELAWIRENTSPDTLLLPLPSQQSNMLTRDSNRSALVIEAVYPFARFKDELELYLERADFLATHAPDDEAWAETWQTFVEISEGRPIAISILNDAPANNAEALENYGIILGYMGEEATIYLYSPED